MTQPNTKTTVLNWNPVDGTDDQYPAPNTRVLAYSPIYEGGDVNMLYRLMDSRFVRISTDVTEWAYIIPPKEETS